ncbi:hypothetical protein VFPPC_16956 [Pochonia chlamydosporia 170]|uniref:BTB domain-containing protein n=1 Tax=Pochonia chlamydosporia 170 TaxID=1380566 RepID=A0A179F007_METCM|nr:hypothetical protein VFPPC_16956 [Pochonia chlamydosporia 170]OAQ58766.2 hypothetical protein VFPPC_16956 [Pochonia chlamydosporia 170]
METDKDENGEFLVLICQGKRINVRKMALSTQDNVFHTACTGPFKVSGSVQFAGQYYFHSGDYDVAVASELEEDISALQIHARMVSLADRYAIDALVSLSATKYSDRLRKSDMLEFLGSIHDVYTLTPSHVRDLRVEAVRHARINLPQHLGNASVRRAYEDIASTTPEFIKELLDSYMETAMIGRCWNCGRCQALEAVQSRCLTCVQLAHLPLPSGVAKFIDQVSDVDISSEGFTGIHIREESPKSDRLPLLMLTAQCPQCMGDESLPVEERTFSYCRPAVMNDHFDREHLDTIKSYDSLIFCNHPKCRNADLKLTSLDHSRNHVARVHGVTLRASRT